MSQYQYDLFVIGAGSGGVRASRMAAATGARVAVAEGSAMGGTCVNLGCIPKKLYAYAAEYGHGFEEARGFGWQSERPGFDWQQLKANRAKEISRLNGIYDGLMDGAKVTVYRDFATIKGAHTVTVAGTDISAERILVAVGGWPFVPDIAGKEHAITSNEIFDLASFPQRLAVVGGGYIASEFASIFKGLGSQVVQIYRRDQLLRGFDQDVRSFVTSEMAKDGIEFRFNNNVTAIEKTTTGLLLQLEDGEQLEVDQVLFATGRVPRTQNLGLEAAGVALNDAGAIKVDERFQTSVPSIYALGDVIDRFQLTPVALAEAMTLVNQLFGDASRTMDYEHIPTAVFTHPNIGTVGLTEAEARAKYGEVVIFKSEFRALKHTLSGSQERTLMKLVVDKASDRVLGLHMVGAEAGEITQGFAVALKAGATKAVFDATIGIHPTAAEEFVTMRTPVKA
ncbi:glutathione-disulfide reductase [Gallaecimonas xiamenensis]|uniref:NADPH-glutathione reductase n=1 Tax=Gallaecimonas xiamenensis 3-C-1 TaxID=745411 RepID=K2JQ38_9GAMM|nr:glutathione-disulfide reductase [Gallaecimonas xiamenensis]EKE77398.1 NADPH-glutathione reductase [Gallaecimonas xiamenensis 3-C-1]